MRPRVIIIGGGFGGLYAARALQGAPVDVMVVDRTNHHVFQPLLYQVATATLAPTDIAAPIRWLLRIQTNTDVLLAEVVAIDPDARVVALRRRQRVELSIFSSSPPARATRTSATPTGRRSRPASRASKTRSSCAAAGCCAFERAERATDAAERAANLTFVIVGGGPTGVELAGMLPTIAQLRAAEGLPPHRYDDGARSFSSRAARALLPAFPEDLSAQRRARSRRARRRSAHEHDRHQRRRRLRRDRQRADRRAHDLLGRRQRRVAARRAARRAASTAWDASS